MTTCLSEREGYLCAVRNEGTEVSEGAHGSVVCKEIFANFVDAGRKACDIDKLAFANFVLTE